MSDIDVKELKSEIAKILSKADLAKTSTKTVIKELEKSMGVELRDKQHKKLIDKLVMKYVNGNQSGSDEDDEEEEEEDEEEEEVKEKKPAKRAAPAPKSKAKRKKSSSEYEESDNSKDSDYEMEANEPSESRGKKKDGEAKGKKGGGRGKGSGYTRAYKLSPALSELMGAEEMPKHEVVKRVWALVKEKNLYDPNNKQFTICDEPLYKVFGIKRFRTFGMMKYLKSHFLDD